MKPLFSQRHKSWIYDPNKLKKKNLSFEGKLRNSVATLLEEHSGHDAYEDGYRYYAQYTDLGIAYMKLVLGEKSFSREDVSTKTRHPDLNLLELIRIGYPSDILDCIEAYLYCVENNDKILYAAIQKSVNGILKIHGSHWRFIEMTDMLIDSSYIAEEVIAVQNEYLNKLGASGVIAEFREAHNAFQVGNYKASVQESQKSLESAIKTVINDNRPLQPSDLIKKLRTANILPGQYANFADYFIKLFGAVNAGRSQPGGAHSQGSEIIEIDPGEAELILNLTAVFNKYLASIYLKQQEEETDVKRQDEVVSLDNESDLPF